MKTKKSTTKGIFLNALASSAGAILLKLLDMLYVVVAGIFK